jgi:hypothetical protein
LGGIPPESTSPTAPGLEIHWKRLHNEALALEQALGATHVKRAGDQQDARAPGQQASNRHRFF